jgi:hypothetical protein
MHGFMVSHRTKSVSHLKRFGDSAFERPPNGDAIEFTCADVGLFGRLAHLVNPVRWSEIITGNSVGCFFFARLARTNLDEEPGGQTGKSKNDGETNRPNSSECKKHAVQGTSLMEAEQAT